MQTFTFWILKLFRASSFEFRLKSYSICMKLLFAAAGSIGHIAPCIAVWRAVQRLESGATAHFVCSTRPEDQSFLRKEDVPFATLSVRRVSLLSLPVMVARAWMLLRRERPAAIFTKGGSVTIPIALAGWLRGIPIVVHESDAVPGRATRFITRFATITIDGFAMGNPLRPGIADGSRERGLAITGLSGTRPVLFVTGGSQGAQALNEVVVRHIDDLLRVVDIIHITGEGKRGIEGTRPGYWKSAFVHGDLAHLYAAADLALSRAGSGAIGELAANGIPTILTPLEGLAQDHQVKNAEAATAAGGCILLPQAFLAHDLVATVRDLAVHPEKRAAMKQKILTLHKPQADVAVAKILLAVARERGVVP